MVSARKYRPSRFDTVIGQEHVVQTLKNAIKNRHLAHAFLFCGPRGVGKTTSARLLAKTINCTNLSDDFEACNECDSCKAFNMNASFNIYELDAASNNSVDDIRGLVEQVRYAPQGAQYKIYIIDEVHMLSSAAFNAFLKTLEEPPSYAKFILATTEKHKILPTILSRCQVFDFHRIKIEDAVKQLKEICTKEQIEAEEEALHVIAKKADGAMRDALSIFDRIVSFSGNKISYSDVISNLNMLDYDYYFKAVNLIMNGNIAGSLLLFDEILNNGFEAQHFLQGFAEHLRNLMVCKHPDTLKLLEVAPNVAGKFAQQCQTTSSSFLLNALNLINQTDLGYRQSKNQRLHVELALMKLCNLNRVIQLNTQQPLVDEKKKTPDLIPQNEVLDQTEHKVETNPQPLIIPITTASPQGNLSALEKLKAQITKNKEQLSKEDIIETSTSFEDIKSDEVTLEMFKSTFDEFLKILETNSKARLSAFLKESPIEWKEPNTAVIELKSEMEFEMIQEERLEFMPWFRSKLKNSNLEIEFTINKDRIVNLGRISKGDQLKMMIEKQPILGEFVQSLGLEIDY